MRGIQVSLNDQCLPNYSATGADKVDLTPIARSGRARECPDFTQHTLVAFRARRVVSNVKGCEPPENEYKQYRQQPGWQEPMVHLADHYRVRLPNVKLLH